MSKEIKFSATVDTSSAKKELNSLENDINRIRSNTSNLGGNGLGGEYKEKNENQKEDPLIKAIRNLVTQLKISKKEDKNNAENSTRSNAPISASNPTINENTNNNKGNKNASEESTTPSIVGKLFSSLAAGNFLINHTKKGMATSKEYQSQAMDIYNRIGVYGNDFKEARKNTSKIGNQLGYSVGETMSLQDTLMSTGGFTNQSDLNKDTKSALELERAYGIDSNQIATIYGQANKIGTYSNGELENFADKIAGGIESSDMQGREDEYVKGINNLLTFLESGNLVVTQDQLSSAQGMLDIISKTNPELKGERGANLVSTFTNGFNANDEKTMRMFGYGTRFSGLEGVKEVQSLIEKGVTNEDSFNALKQGLQDYGIKPGTTQSEAILRQSLGTTWEESKVISDFMAKNDYKGMVSQLETKSKKDEKLKNAVSSDAMQNEAYNANKDNADAALGDKTNSLTKPFKSLYNKIPTSLQSTTDVGLGIGGTILGGKLLTKGLNSASNLFKGSNTLNGVGEATKGASSLFKGSNVASKVINSGTKGSEILGKASSFAPIIMTAGYGIESISDFSKGNKKGGTESLGGLGGALGGAKLGAMLGTAIAPGIGTAIGAIGGSILGDKLGRKITGFGYDKLSKSETNNEENKDNKEVIYTNDDLIIRQETLVKKEEELVDKLLKKYSLNSDLQSQNLSTNLSNVTDNYPESLEKNDNSGKYISSDGKISSDNKEIVNFSNNLSSSMSDKLIGNDNENKIWNFFKNKGYSNEATAGIIGNLKQESGLDPTKLQSGGGPGRGIAQWTIGSDRWQGLQSYAKEKGTSWSDLQTQLEFMEKEMNSKNTYWNKTSAGSLQNFKNMNNSDEAVVAFEKAYERAGKPVYSKRKEYALNALAKAPKSYAIGNKNISEDQIAYLHKEETVLNKYDAKDYREGKDKATNNNNVLNVNINGRATDDETKQLVINAVKQAIQNLGIKGNVIDTSQSFVRVPN